MHSSKCTLFAAVLLAACNGKVAGDSGARTNGALSPADQARALGATVLAEGQTPACVTQDTDRLYWVNVDGHVVSVSKAGGPLVTSVYARTPLAEYEHCAIAVDGDAVYVTIHRAGKIAKMPITREPFAIGDGKLLGELSAPSSIAVDADFVYVTSDDSGTITKIDRKNDDDPGTEIARGAEGASSLVQDADALYWLDGMGVRRWSKKGSAITIVGSGQMVLVYGGGVLVWMTTGDEAGRAKAPAQPLEPVKLPFADSRKCTMHGQEVYTSSGFEGLAVNGADLFYPHMGTLYRAPLGGGDGAPMFTISDPCDELGGLPSNLLADDTRLFWTMSGNVIARAL